jgi:hypothetical protein
MCDMMIACGLLNRTFPPPLVTSFDTAMSTNAASRKKDAAATNKGLLVW